MISTIPKNPKKYVCNEHNKCYVYKKSSDEHLCRDHSDGNYRFMCDYCGKGFFHKNEFSIHSQKFTDWKQLQKHKIDCVKVPQKFSCSKCNRGFQQKTVMEQHFDFYHTKKPKKYVCNEHNKCYVYKKSSDEHLCRDHSDGNYRFMCDYCGKGFFHKNEFSIHSQKFTDWKQLQKHKIDCVKVPQKFSCSKCNRGFQQKTVMEQHFDFYHTKKPKKYVCNEHNKCYVYKKSSDEHLCRDHSDGNYRFMCDYCGKGFFHKNEFSIHRDSVHLKRKDYACNKCQQRAFTSI